MINDDKECASGVERFCRSKWSKPSGTEVLDVGQNVISPTLIVYAVFTLGEAVEHSLLPLNPPAVWLMLQSSQAARAQEVGKEGEGERERG